jgi:hypothetical protein
LLSNEWSVLSIFIWSFPFAVFLFLFLPMFCKFLFRK